MDTSFAVIYTHAYANIHTIQHYTHVQTHPHKIVHLCACERVRAYTHTHTHTHTHTPLNTGVNNVDTRLPALIEK